ncbi:MAG: DUF4830 domain-containing protein [Clostridia bacterium]|nr:DUF4830 domain-containing protein [Clostridia bacterium]
MVIGPIRANALKLLGILCVSLTVLIALIAFVPTYGSVAVSKDAAEASYSYDKIKSASDAANFLRQFGWEIDDEPTEVKTVMVPAEFDKVFSAYNEIQKAQGLNLTRYRGKEVTRFTFRVLNCKDTDLPVYANVLVYKKRVVGGDVYSSEFVKGFEG